VRHADIGLASKENPVLLKVIADLRRESFRRTRRSWRGRADHDRRPLPEGADTVVPVEDTIKADGTVKIFDPLAGGWQHPPSGRRCRQGGKSSSGGNRPAAGPRRDAGFPAPLIVYVYLRPRVAVLSTGDELLEIDEPWQDGKIINSNSYSIAAQVLEGGGEPFSWGLPGTAAKICPPG